MPKKLPRQWWSRVYFPNEPNWLWVLVIVARRHGYSNRDLWRFILATVRAHYRTEWDEALRASNMERYEWQIDNPPDELR